MKRDMDLIRKLLMHVEAPHVSDEAHSNLLEGYTAAQIGYHAYLLKDAGLAEGVEVTGMNDSVPQYELRSLTWNGHEFLDAARNETRWAKAKKCFAAVGGFSLPLLMELLRELMKEKIGP